MSGTGAQGDADVELGLESPSVLRGPSAPVPTALREPEGSEEIDPVGGAKGVGGGARCGAGLDCRCAGEGSRTGGTWHFLLMRLMEPLMCFVCLRESEREGE